VISDADVDNVDGTITVTGSLSDDGGLDGLSMTLDGGTGTITINDDGTFSVNITDTQGNQTFTITVTDANGNSTTHTFSY